MTTRPPSLSAVIPTLNEEGTIAPLVASLSTEVDEIWVVDGGSRDRTASIARESGAEVLRTRAPSRGAQLDLGARSASTEAIVFVHADTQIPTGFGSAIRTALTDARVVGGNFRVRYAPASPSAEVFGWLGDLRQHWLGLYYGDSCIFARREVYAGTGGFADHPLFEDHALARALRRRGRTVMVDEPVIISSSRRFRNQPARTLALWGLLQLGYSIGVSPVRLATLYRAVR